LTVAGLQMLNRSFFGALHGDSARRRMGFEKLYIVGGRGASSDALATLYQYDSMANAWEALASMSTARMSLAVAAIDGKLYVMGGSGPNGYLSSVERFDPAKNAWEAVAPMSMARGGPAAAAIDGSCM